MVRSREVDRVTNPHTAQGTSVAPRRPFFLTAGIVVVLPLAAAPSAFAAVRYAEVSGNGAPTVCAQSDPCSIEDAVEHSSVNDGDEVVVLPGTYDVGTGTVLVDNDITVQGAAGAPRPNITTASTTAFNGAVTVAGSGATVRDLELENTGGAGDSAALWSNVSVTAERLVARSNSSGATCTVIDGTLRDSLCLNTSTGPGFGILIGGSGSFTTNLRNVTTVAQGTSAFSDGIWLNSSGIAYTINAKNVIANGNSNDVRAEQSGGGSATVNFDHSNYDSVDPASSGTVTAPGTGTGNQTAAPVFVNAAGGNYRQAPNSPTLEAGDATGLGTADFEGDPRSMDGDCDDADEPDIGADEFPDCPPNDDFANAQTILGSTASVNGTNVNTTEEASEPDYCTEDVCGDHPTIKRSVWYRWTSPGGGPATIDVCTSNYDTILAVFTGSGLGSLSTVAANNNHVDCPPGSFASKVSFNATQGATYHFLVDGCCGLPQGTFTLNLAGPEAPPPPPQPEPDAGDADPPDTTITGGPKDKTGSRSATFAFSSSEPGSSFQCAVDGQALRVPCTSPYTVKVKKGKHTFRVRATDPAGNVDATPATDSWKVKKKKKR
jgi:hypothetical protein